LLSFARFPSSGFGTRWFRNRHWEIDKTELGKFHHAAPDRRSDGVDASEVTSACRAKRSARRARLIARSRARASLAFVFRAIASSGDLILFHSFVGGSPSGVPSQVSRYSDGALFEP
jgi:hypothetical protein